MADLTSARAMKNMTIAAASSLVIVFLACLGANAAFKRPSPSVLVVQTTGGTASTAESAQDPQELERQATIAKAERMQREREQAAQSEAIREQKLQEALAARQAAAEQDRKDAAWARFYKKPKKCDNPYDDKVIVECSNHYLQEQSRFEKLYAAGKL